MVHVQRGHTLLEFEARSDSADRIILSRQWEAELDHQSVADEGDVPIIVENGGAALLALSR